MAKKTTTRRSPSSTTPSSVEEKKVVETKEPEPVAEKSAAPKVKKIAVKPVPGPAEPAPPTPKLVELMLGETYEVKGFTFRKDRPVVVADPDLLAEVEVNSRFKVTGADRRTT